MHTLQTYKQKNSGCSYLPARAGDRRKARLEGVDDGVQHQQHVRCRDALVPTAAGRLTPLCT